MAMIYGETFEEREARQVTRDELLQAWYDGMSPTIRSAYGPDLGRVVQGSTGIEGEMRLAMSRMALALTFGHFEELSDRGKENFLRAQRAAQAYQSSDAYTGPTGYEHIDTVCEAERTILEAAAHDPGHELEVLMAIENAKIVGRQIGAMTTPHLPLAV